MTARRGIAASPAAPRTRGWATLAALLALLAVACGGDASDPAAVAASTSSDATAPAVGADAAPETGYAIGARAPDFTVDTVNGDAFTLSEVTAAGTPVLLYFFATW